MSRVPAVHRALRHRFDALPALVHETAVGDAAAVRACAEACADAVGALLRHLTAEEEVLWPSLPADAALLRAEEQHERVREVALRLGAQAEAFRRDPSVVGRDALATTADALRTALADHLDDEERTVLPLTGRTSHSPHTDADAPR